MLRRTAMPMLALGAALAIPACSSNTADPVDTDSAAVVTEAAPGRTFELHAGETARITGLGMLVFFRGVQQDSRCPTDVTCVWEGDAALRIRVAERGGDWTPFDLHTTLDPQTATVGGHTLTVVGLTPTPVSGRTIPNEQYTVTLRVD